MASSMRRARLRSEYAPGQARDAADYRVRNARQAVEQACHELALAVAAKRRARATTGTP